MKTLTTTTGYNTLSELITSRHSVKRYDPNVKISEAEMKEMLDLAHKAPSSWNLQNWRFLVVTSEEGKKKLHQIAYNQIQVIEASATIVILGDLEANRTAEEIFGEALQAGVLTEEVYHSMMGSINAAYEDKQVAKKHAYLNISLAAMQLMLIAKAKGYDTNPMTGFNSKDLVKEFNIPERYEPIMLMPIGKAAHAPRISDRLDIDRIIIKETF